VVRTNLPTENCPEGSSVEFTFYGKRPGAGRAGINSVAVGQNWRERHASGAWIAHTVGEDPRLPQFVRPRPPFEGGLR